VFCTDWLIFKKKYFSIKIPIFNFNLIPSSVYWISNLILFSKNGANFDTKYTPTKLTQTLKIEPPLIRNNGVRPSSKNLVGSDVK